MLPRYLFGAQPVVGRPADGEEGIVVHWTATSLALSCSGVCRPIAGNVNSVTDVEIHPRPTVTPKAPSECEKGDIVLRTAFGHLMAMYVRLPASSGTWAHTERFVFAVAGMPGDSVAFGRLLFLAGLTLASIWPT